VSVIAFTTPKFRCALCGTRVSAADSSYSKQTKNHYHTDHNACGRRRGKKAA